MLFSATFVDSTVIPAGSGADTDVMLLLLRVTSMPCGTVARKKNVSVPWQMNRRGSVGHTPLLHLTSLKLALENWAATGNENESKKNHTLEHL